MKALPTQDRALKKRAALIEAAITEFSNAGFEVATAKSIAQQAGVATGTFYQYFENKNDILRVIAQERIFHLHSQIPDLAKAQAEAESSLPLSFESIVAVFEQTLRFVYDFHAQHPELHQVLEHRRALDPELRDIMHGGEDVLRERVLAFVQSMQIDQAEIVANNLFSMAEGLVHRHVFDTPELDLQSVLEVGARMLASYFAVPNQD